MADFKPRVAVTLGDPAGIGPEIVAKALSSLEVRDRCAPVIVGDARIFDDVMRRFVPDGLPVRTVRSAAEIDNRDSSLWLLDLPTLDPVQVRFGQVSAECGHAFVAWSRAATQLALSGQVDAVASAPINKESMNLAGEHFDGQTELITNDLGVTNFCTVLTGGLLRVYLVSSHVSLLQAIRLVERARIERILRLAVMSLRDLWGIDRPHIGVAALNPHAGEGGMFGREEIEEITPAIEALRADGADVVGPEPADSLYHMADNGHFDGVIGMFHDQGTIPLKRYGYVTVIAGAPIVRTTAGHGTAYNIAGQGLADASLMQRAILTAAELAALRHSRRHAGYES